MDNKPTRARRVGILVAVGTLIATSGAAVAHERQGDPLSKRIRQARERGDYVTHYPDGRSKPRRSTTTTAPSTTAATTTSTAPTTLTPPSTTAATTTSTAPAPTTIAPTTRPAPASSTPPTTVAAPAANAKYVAPNGDDGAAGTQAAPWKSLPVAVSRLNPGDTLYVRGGTHQVPANNAMYIENKNGDPGRVMRIMAFPGESPIVKLDDFWNGFKLTNSSYVYIGGLEIVGTANVDQRFTSGIEIRNSHHVTAERNKVHDVGGCGICAIESNHVSITGNLIYNTSNWNSYQTSAISFFTSRNLGGGANADGYSMYIVGNTVRNSLNIARPSPGEKTTDGNCIIIDYNKTFGYSGRTLVANNHCSDNGGRGVHVFHSSEIDVINNTLVNNLRSAEIDGGELTASSSTKVLWRNNLVSPQRAGAGNISWDATPTYDHNLYVGQAPPLRAPSDLVVGGAIATDGRPLAGSPAINAGNPALAPNVDLAGRTRNGPPDIGAFEGQ